ncbi:acetoacetate decarboxylase family protein [bacterium]|nr:acetoacetate decarboxylase family protein [bacterium]
MQQAYPPYITRGGEQVFCQPFLVKDVDSHCYVLQADINALAAMCDRYLNTPLATLGDGKTIYRPFSSFVMLSFSHLTQTHAERPPEAWFEEHEAILWMLTVAGREEAGVFIADRFAWFTPYIFVDSPPAMLAGEIIYGFPKAIANVSLGQTPEAPFTVDTTVVAHYGYDSQATMQRLLTLRPANPASGDHTELQTLEETVRTALARLPKEHHKFVLPDLHFLTSAIEDLFKGRMPVVALKQFRDAADGTRACYQAIVEFDLTMSNLHGMSVRFDPWELEIADYQSHPIVKDFGFTGSTVPTFVSTRMQYDLQLGEGRKIAEFVQLPQK